MDPYGVEMKDLVSGLVGGVFGALATAVGSFFAFRVAQRQIGEMTRTMQAQTYISILERAERIRLSPTMDLIRTFECESSYSSFKEFSRAQRRAVRGVIDFFNDLAHLMRNEYIDDRRVPRLYYPSIHACGEKLGAQWLDELRRDQRQPYLYENFEHLCRYIRNLRGYEDEIERDPFGDWFKREHRSPGCPICARLSLLAASANDAPPRG